jgi:2-oxoacid dehydrogenase/acyltransferase catalytic subunit
MTLRPETSASLRAAGHDGRAKERALDRRVERRVGRVDFTDRGVTENSCIVQRTSSGFFVSLDVEMTHARAALERLAANAAGGSYAGILTRAAALAISRQGQEGTQVTRQAWPGPRGAPARLRRWGWMLPFGWVRRLILRVVLSPPPFRALFGALQVNVLPGANVATCGRGTTAKLGLGAVAERVVVRRGQPAVRWMATLTCSGDCREWDGARIARVLNDVKRILESGALLERLTQGPANDLS